MQCASHPTSPATRQCSQCQRAWCGLCVKQLEINWAPSLERSEEHGKLLEVCPRCTGRLREPYQRAAAAPFSVGESLGRVLSGDALITAVAMASPILLSGLVDWIPGMGWFVLLMSLLYYGTLVGYYFEIIGHVGDDKPGLPGASDLVGDWSSLAAMVLRGGFVVGLGLLPLVVYTRVVHADGTAPSLVVEALLALVGLAYTPAVLVSVVVTQSTLGALYPIAWVKMIAHAPRSYAELVALFLAGLVAFALWGLVSNLLEHLPVVGGYVATVGKTLLWMAQAALVGAFLRRHAEEFGWS